MQQRYSMILFCGAQLGDECSALLICKHKVGTELRWASSVLVYTAVKILSNEMMVSVKPVQSQ